MVAALFDLWSVLVSAARAYTADALTQAAAPFIAAPDVAVAFSLLMRQVHERFRVTGFRGCRCRHDPVCLLLAADGRADVAAAGKPALEQKARAALDTYSLCRDRREGWAGCA